MATAVCREVDASAVSSSRPKRRDLLAAASVPWSRIVEQTVNLHENRSKAFRNLMAAGAFAEFLLEFPDLIQLDFEAVFTAAIAHNVAMEINADPHRLDLHDTAIQLGKRMGVTFAINTDAHTPTGFSSLRYGVDEARRGWLEKGDVLNTKGLAGLRKWLGIKHHS